MSGLARLHRKAVEDGDLSAKVKELMALAAISAIGCEGCMTYHPHDAIPTGATRAEWVETISVGVMTLAPALRFGDSVRVQYFDLFDPDCPALPDDAQLPLVLLNGEVLSSGGKISMPAIRKRLEASGVVTARQ